ncbi:MAG: ArsR/SmtB family transcription factor [Blastocatellia bacterium]
MMKQLNFEALELIAERFRILSEPTRLRILCILQKGELTVNGLTEALDISQPNASKHLRILQDAGILQREQRGNSAYYSIADQSIFELCDVVCDSLGEKFKQKADMFSFA